MPGTSARRPRSLASLGRLSSMRSSTEGRQGMSPNSVRALEASRLRAPQGRSPLEPAGSCQGTQLGLRGPHDGLCSRERAPSASSSGHVFLEGLAPRERRMRRGYSVGLAAQTWLFPKLRPSARRGLKGEDPAVGLSVHLWICNDSHVLLARRVTTTCSSEIPNHLRPCGKARG